MERHFLAARWYPVTNRSSLGRFRAEVIFQSPEQIGWSLLFVSSPKCYCPALLYVEIGVEHFLLNIDLESGMQLC